MTCCKKILFLFLIFVFLFCTFSFGTEVNNNPTSGGGSSTAHQNDNEIMTLMSIQECVQNRFIFNLLSRKGSTGTQQLVDRIFNLFPKLGARGRFLYIQENKSGNEYNYLVYIGLYDQLQRTCVNTYSIGNQAFPNTSVLRGNYYLVGGITPDYCYVINDDNQTAPLTVSFGESLVISPSFMDLFVQYGNINDTNSTAISNTITNQANITREEIKNSTDKINDNLNNNDVSNVDTSGITNSDTTVDITQDGFNSIFNTLQTYFTSNNGGSLTITLPFVNKTITISKGTVFGNFKQLSTIENFASLAWYFVISLYIVKSIQRMINKIKGGNLEDVVDNNVKADILQKGD